jgi:hypothetical protein
VLEHWLQPVKLDFIIERRESSLVDHSVSDLDLSVLQGVVLAHLLVSCFRRSQVLVFWAKPVYNCMVIGVSIVNGHFVFLIYIFLLLESCTFEVGLDIDILKIIKIKLTFALSMVAI